MFGKLLILTLNFFQNSNLAMGRWVNWFLNYVYEQQKIPLTTLTSGEEKDRKEKKKWKKNIANKTRRNKKKNERQWRWKRTPHLKILMKDWEIWKKVYQDVNKTARDVRAQNRCEITYKYKMVERFFLFFLFFERHWKEWIFYTWVSLVSFYPVLLID